jgi:hypothetical protein
MNRTFALNTVVVSRMSFGVAVWAFPGPVCRAFGFDMTRNPQAAYMARLVGVRDFALAAGVIATEGDNQRQWLLAGLACDSADTLAAIVAGANGMSKRTTAGVLAAALWGVVCGAFALKAREQ